MTLEKPDLPAESVRLKLLRAVIMNLSGTITQLGKHDQALARKMSAELDALVEFVTRYHRDKSVDPISDHRADEIRMEVIEIDKQLEAILAKHETATASTEAAKKYGKSVGEPAAKKAPSVAPGIYRHAGEIFKAHTNRAGRTYALQLTRLPVGGYGYQYARGKIYRLEPSMRITEEQAAKYSNELGCCIVCIKPLYSDFKNRHSHCLSKI